MQNMYNRGLLLLLCVAVVFAANTPQHVHLSLSSSQDEMVVIWHTVEPAASSVQYGIHVEDSEDVAQRSVTGESYAISLGTGYMHRATMTGLLPNKVYKYRVGDANAGYSPFFQFRSRRSPSDQKEFTIVAFGDMGTTPSQPGSDDFALALQQPAVLASTDFVLHAGDLCYAFKNETKIDRWFTQLEPVMAQLPYMIVPGNRDDEELVHERFAMPGAASGSSEPNFYWSTDYNSVHVVGISTSQARAPLELDSAQYRWLEADLRHAAAMVADPNSPLQWIVLVGHTPLYSSSNGHDGGNKKLKAVMEHLLWKYGVTLAIWGDDHGYERTYPLFNDEHDDTATLVGDEQVIQNPNRTVHFVVGTAGVSLDGWTSSQRPVWSAARALTWGHLSLTVADSSIKGRFVAIDGQVLDSFKIVRTSPRKFLPYILLLVVFLALVALFARYQTRFEILRSAAGPKLAKAEAECAAMESILVTSGPYETSSPAPGLRLKLSSNSLQRR
eukprot:TRINITY_DN793_c0_g2_i1.p1 TRINITY_DN793_c0_g2~~TRINITY_DN793_c0_g2_i1.p1  ORF type:complete len:500 (+),score=180.97 TRINITY_DN793_c0_g2_i1:103-1602(+)